MAVNLDPTQGTAASAGGRLDRHDAEARQGRWMLELERAMFSTTTIESSTSSPSAITKPTMLSWFGL